MAYDKVVDSAALEAALKASADAIRGKTGGSGSIPWDAVKGFADAIAAIEAGGGSGGGGFTWGTVVPEETNAMNYVPIEHGLGKRPACFLLFVLPDGNTTTENDQIRWGFSSYLKGSILLYKNGSAATTYTEKEHTISTTQDYWDATSDQFTTYAFVQQVNASTFATNNVIKAVGKTNVWVAFANDFT